MASVRCAHCAFVNFATEPACKRCKLPLSPVAPATIGYTPATLAQHATPQPGPAHQEIAPPPPYQAAPPPYMNAPYGQAAYQASPYAPPYTNAPPPYASQINVSVWRRREHIIMYRDSDLPDYCVKCNAPVVENDKHRQRFYWHNPALYLLLISPIIYAIVAVIVSRRTTLYVGLCQQHRKTRSNALIAGWATGLGGLFSMFFSFSMNFTGFGMFCMMLMVIGPIICAFIAQSLRVTEMDDKYIWLKGASEEFLASLPAWEGRNRNR